MKSQQRLADRLRNQAARLRFAMKFYFSLGRMDVDVHRSRINFQKQAKDWIAAFHECRVIALQQCKIQPAIFHWPAIHEQVLFITRRAGNAGLPDEAPEPEGGGRSWRINQSG